MRLQSDILGKKVVRPVVNETTALGAAYAAGLAVGFWKNVDDLRINWAEDVNFTPTASPEKREAGYKGWKKAIEKSKGWVE
jgi:glycerol kinase